MKLMFAALACLLATTGAAAASRPSQDSKPLEPSSSWRVNFGDTQCSLIRKFGAGRTLSTVQLDRDGPLSDFNLGVTMTTVPEMKKHYRVDVQFDGDSHWTKANTVASTLPDGTKLLGFPDLRNSFWKGLDERFATDAPVVLRLRFKRREIAFNLQKMKKLKKVLDQCEDNLMTAIGLDGPTLRALRTQARALPGASHWIDPDKDYPPKMHRKGKSGLVRVRLIIGKSGRLTGCNVLASIGGDAFGKVTCDLMLAHAQYKPAISASGKPVKSYFETRVRWTP